MSQVTDHAAQTSRTENILGMRIIWDAPIEMDDGVILRADVFLPEAEGKYPVVISLGPYAKGLSFQTGYKGSWDRMIAAYPEIAEGTTAKYANWELVDPEKWTRDGYVCLRVDGRGSGRSPGKLDLLSPRETKDFYDCIEWAGMQPWSSGKVGINGISYYAINQRLVAALQPPHQLWYVAAQAAVPVKPILLHTTCSAADLLGLAVCVACCFENQFDFVRYGVGHST